MELFAADGHDAGGCERVTGKSGMRPLPIDCKFLLDYETGAEETGSSRKKPYRCRWPDEICEEILARLLELNVQRAAEEVYDGRGDRATASNRWPV